MEKQDHIDKALAFIEQTHKLGAQLEAAEGQQKIYLSRMIEMKKNNQTAEEEYANLSAKSKGLQDMIDKWRPVYLERMEMLRDVKNRK